MKNNMHRLSGWYRLLVVIAILWGMAICIFAWQVYEQRKTEIYSHWYKDLYTGLNDSSYSWIDNPNITIPDLIKIIEKKLNENEALCKQSQSQSQNPFMLGVCDQIPTTVELRNKYQNMLNHVLTLSFVMRALLLWMLPILLVYLITIAIRWVYRGFNASNNS